MLVMHRGLIRNFEPTFFIFNSVVAVPVVTVDNETSTTIQISWTSSGHMVDRYEVTWKRDRSGMCHERDNGDAVITDSSTSYNITGLEESSSYIVSVIAFSVAEIAISVPVTRMTREAG